MIRDFNCDLAGGRARRYVGLLAETVKIKLMLSAELVYDLCVCPPPLGSPGERREE
jgi:hypothetical protein